MLVTKRKHPRTNDRYVGIEIEFLSPLERSKIISILSKSKIKTLYHIQSDSSIKPSKMVPLLCAECSNISLRLIQNSDSIRYSSCGHACSLPLPNGYLLGHELSVLVKESQLQSILITLSHDLRTIKARVNNSCGLHVHLDMRHRDKDLCFYNLVKKQALLFSLVKKERRLSAFCSKTKPGAKREATNHHNAIYGNTNYETIEVRMHHGTTNVREIYKWCKLLISIVDKETKQQKKAA